MPEYTYKASNDQSQEVTGQMSAKNPEDLKKSLEEQGLTVDSFSAKEQSEKIKFSFSERFSNVTNTDKIFFTQNMEVMVRTGFSLSVALDAISQQTKNTKFKKIIINLKNEVEGGISLSKSLKKYPKVFSAIYVSMIEAGEVSGKLQQMLKRITIQMKKDNTIKSKVKGALIYPAIITIAMFGIGIFAMIFVIPKITSIFDEVGADLPMVTKILINTSNFLANNTVTFLIAFIILIVGFQRAIASKTGKKIWHKLLLRTPVASGIIKKFNLARFSRTLSSLLQTDIPIVQSFNIISNTLANVYYKEFIIEVGKSLEKGEPLKKILRREPKLFPPVVTQMISVGEETGTLDTISEEIAIFYEEEIDQTMANLTVIIEPVLMIFLGVAIGGVAAAIVMPMYNISSQI